MKLLATSHVSKLVLFILHASTNLPMKVFLMFIVAFGNVRNKKYVVFSTYICYIKVLN